MFKTKNLVLVLLGSILGILTKYLNNLYVLIFDIIIAILMFVFYKKKVLWFIIPFSFFILISDFNYQIDNPKEKYLVVETHDGYYYLVSNFRKYIFYSDEVINKFAIIKLNPTIKRNDFNINHCVTTFNDYLHNIGINYSVESNELEILFKGDVIYETIKNLLVSSVSDESKKLIGLLVLGDKSYDEALYKNMQNIGVVHLFVISGFHLNIIYGFISKIFKRRNEIVLCLLLIPYLYIVGFSISITRAFIYLLVKLICKKKSKIFNPSKTNLLIALMFILVDYHNIFNLSFLLTFITNIGLSILSNIRITNKIAKLIISLLIQLSILPIVIYVNYEWNILSIIFTLAIAIIVPPIYILCLITSVFKITDILLKNSYKILSLLIEMFDNINKPLIFGKPSLLFSLLFYVMLFALVYFILIKNKKKSLVNCIGLVTILFAQYNSRLLFGMDEVIFIDVKQGDSTLIIGKNNSYNILIDTGGLRYKDTANAYIIPLLKAKGIHSLDALIITHDDFDHCGSKDSLLANINVSKVYYAYNEQNIIVNELFIQNLNTYKDKSSDNYNSGVLLFKNDFSSFLIMGDAPIEIENKLIKDNDIVCDVLRTGHHGSETSTSADFLNAIKPSYCIISVGTNNYGHPSSKVLDLINSFNIPYFRTDYSHNILFKKNKIIENY